MWRLGYFAYVSQGLFTHSAYSARAPRDLSRDIPGKRRRGRLDKGPSRLQRAQNRHGHGAREYATAKGAEMPYQKAVSLPPPYKATGHGGDRTTARNPPMREATHQAFRVDWAPGHQPGRGGAYQDPRKMRLRAAAFARAPPTTTTDTHRKNLPQEEHRAPNYRPANCDPIVFT